VNKYASDIVNKVKGEDHPTPGPLRGNRVRCYVGDFSIMGAWSLARS